MGPMRRGSTVLSKRDLFDDESLTKVKNFRRAVSSIFRRVRVLASPSMSLLLQQELTLFHRLDSHYVFVTHGLLDPMHIDSPRYPLALKQGQFL